MNLKYLEHNTQLKLFNYPLQESMLEMYIDICICGDLFARSSVGKESACNAGDLGLSPESERSPGEGNGNPRQYSCLENPMDREAWRATIHGVEKSQTWLSMHTLNYWSFSHMRWKNKLPAWEDLKICEAGNYSLKTETFSFTGYISGWWKFVKIPQVCRLRKGC